MKLSTGDFVYLRTEPSGPAKKLRNQYSGPFIVHDLTSPHMVQLRDIHANSVHKQPVHIARLKAAYIREPTPSAYFKVNTRVPDAVQSSVSTQTDTFNPTTKPITNPIIPPNEPILIETSCTRPNARSENQLGNCDYTDPQESSTEDLLNFIESNVF